MSGERDPGPETGPGDTPPAPAGAQSPTGASPSSAARARRPEMAVASSGQSLSDGQWHRLHPATPLLRGGVVTIAILAIVLANFRERLIEWLIPGGGEWCFGSGCEPGEEGYPGDPIAALVESGYLVVALAIAAGVLLLIIGGFWLSWRMHEFRITDELVEVRSGILFRTHRQGRLDRIQGIAVTRPLFARIFGAARLEITVAGQSGNVQLAYLGGAKADALRAAILRLASGARRAAAPAPAAPDPSALLEGAPSPAPADESVLDRRIAEFTAPELDPSLAEPQSIVAMPPGRLIGSTLLSGALLWLLIPLLAVAGVSLIASATGEPFLAVPILIGTFVPVVIAAGTYMVNRVVKSLRFTIARTPDGVRVGYGLLSTSNETLPPGRIHSISVSQPLLWRPADWWEVKVNRAGHSSAQGAAGRQNTTLLPVGTREDALRVIELVLPALEADELRALVGRGLEKGAPDDGYTTSPARAAVLRWFSWRRNGFSLAPDAVLLRRGAIWRELVIVPTPRMQSVSLRQGPLLRALRLAAVHAHTVVGPVSTRLGALDVRDAERFWAQAAATGVAAARADRTQRWGET